MSQDHHTEISHLLTEKKHTAEELDAIIFTRSEWTASAHACGAYGAAKEHALMVALARQLKERMLWPSP
jgi:hypothetical protein